MKAEDKSVLGSDRCTELSIATATYFVSDERDYAVASPIPHLSKCGNQSMPATSLGTAIEAL